MSLDWDPDSDGNTLLGCIDEFYLSVKGLSKYLRAVESHTNAVVLDKLHRLIKIEFPEDVEHGFGPLFFDAWPLISDDCVKPHVVF